MFSSSPALAPDVAGCSCHEIVVYLLLIVAIGAWPATVEQLCRIFPQTAAAAGAVQCATTVIG